MDCINLNTLHTHYSGNFVGGRRNSKMLKQVCEMAGEVQLGDCEIIHVLCPSYNHVKTALRMVGRVFPLLDIKINKYFWHSFACQYGNRVVQIRFYSKDDLFTIRHLEDFIVIG